MDLQIFWLFVFSFFFFFTVTSKENGMVSRYVWSLVIKSYVFFCSFPKSCVSKRKPIMLYGTTHILWAPLGERVSVMCVHWCKTMKWLPRFANRYQYKYWFGISPDPAALGRTSSTYIWWSANTVHWLWAHAWLDCGSYQVDVILAWWSFLRFNTSVPIIWLILMWDSVVHSRAFMLWWNMYRRAIPHKHTHTHTPSIGSYNYFSA